MKMKKTCHFQNNPAENKAGWFTLPDIKTYWSMGQSRQWRYQNKGGHLASGKEQSPEINTHVDGQLITNKGFIEENGETF